MAYQPTNWEHGDTITGGKLNKIEQELTHVADNATYGFGGAQLSSDGLTPLSYINAGDPMPSNPQKGDTVFLKDGNDFLIYSYNGEDWVLKVDPDLSNRIEETIKTASNNTDKAIADNNTQINETINQVAKEQVDLAIKDGDFNNKAQAMADKALSDAKANTTTVAKETLDTATENLTAAKKSLTTDLQKEVSDRTTAVAALDTKAKGYADDVKNNLGDEIAKEVSDRQEQVSGLDTKAKGYADQAKQDAISAATTADGVINKKIDDTKDSITTTINQNKVDADGKITTAQSTATQALNEVKTKVSQTEYNSKTGQLTTDVNTVTQTANQSKQDIVAIKQKDGDQDSRMNTIESDASGTKQTVSQLQTVQGQQSGSISTLQQRADGFDATVTKVNNLSTGDRNYILDTGNPKTQTSNGKDNQDFYNSASLYEPLKNWGVANADYIISFDWSLKDVLSSDMTIGVFFNQPPWQANYKTIPANQKNGHIEINFKLWAQMLVADKDVTGITFRINSQMSSGNQITYSNLFMKSGNISNNWTPAPEDGEQATAKAQLTADQAKTELTNYKVDANGRISKAQSDITQTANQVATKVSQSDYNAKTGELTTNVNTVTQTANQAKTDIASIKQTDTSQDARMTTIESDASGTKTIVSNLQTVQGQQTGSISTLQQRADGFDATVTKVNNLSTGDRNYILDTGNPKTQTSNGKDNQDFYNSASLYEPLKNWGVANADYIISFDWSLKDVLSSDMTIGVFFNQPPWQANYKTIPANQKNGHIEINFKLWAQMLVADKDVTGITFRINSQMSSGNQITYSNLFMKSGNISNNWTPAPEDGEQATAKAQLTADQAKTELNAYKTNADGRITKAQSDITQTAKDVTTKVSQSDYDKKTGDLSTSVSKAQQTADSAVTTIGNYKTSNDNRVKATETSIAQNTKDITLRATNTDLDSAKKDYNAQIAQVKVDANSITTSLSNASSSAFRYVRFRGEGNNDNGGTHFGHLSVFNTVGTDLIAGKTATTIGNPSISGNGLAGATTGKYNTSYISMDNSLNSEKYVVFDLGSVRYDVNKIEIGMWTPVRTYYGVTAQISYDGVIWTTLFKGNIDKTFLVGDSTTGQVVGTVIPIGNSNAQLSAQQITIDGITDTVSKQGTNIDSVTKRVQTAEGTLSTATDNISGLQTKQTQTANQVTQEISDRTKGDSNTLQSSKDFTQSSITSYDNGVQTQLTQTSNAILAKVGATNLFPNSEFAQNYGYAGSGTVVVSGSVKNNIDNKYSGTVSVTSTSAGYQGYWTNKIPVYGGKKYSASVLVHYTNGGLSNGLAMLDIWFYDKDNKRISGASRSTGQVSSPYWVKLSNEGFAAPINAVSVQVSLLVNNAGAGQVATFSQPLVTATEKLQEYTPNDDMSAQLSLFKDNWSIGITDNISKITSGIVGNASQMSLISKNVTIDSPNTQIKGTAWIQSAMIANGAIGSAQIGDATITSAKIATLDVAKLTGNVSSFIQSNWNGSYGSTQITSNGMTVTSKSPRADLSIRSVFDANGLTMYTPKGATAIRNGETAYISSSSEDIGMMGTVKWAPHPNVDYLMIGLHGWHTTTPGDSSYDQNSDGSNVVYGGDGIGFGISNANGGYDMLMTWDSPLVAGYQGRMSGWHVEDVFTTHLMSYAAGGLKVSSQYSEGERSLHTEGITINNNSRWFGFLDGSGNVGFGTDQTQDVIVLIKGKPYSMYTMLNKLGMLK